MSDAFLDIVIIDNIMSYGLSHPNVLIYYHADGSNCNAEEFRYEMLNGPTDVMRNDYQALVTKGLSKEKEDVIKGGITFSKEDGKNQRKFVRNALAMKYMHDLRGEDVVPHIKSPSKETLVTWKFLFAKHLINNEVS